MIYLRALLDAHRWRPRSALPPAPRPLTLHLVAGGGCDGCLVEANALQGAAYDLARHDIRFVDTPHDAELLFVVGVVTRALLPALQARWAAMPSPKGVVAIGDCALGQGPFGTNYATLGGIMEPVCRACSNAMSPCVAARRHLPTSFAACFCSPPGGSFRHERAAFGARSGADRRAGRDASSVDPRAGAQSALGSARDRSSLLAARHEALGRAADAMPSRAYRTALHLCRGGRSGRGWS